MTREFAIERTGEIAATPEDYWAAVTTGNAGWLWPMEAPEPWEGGAGPFGATVRVWDPPRHLVSRVDLPDGVFNQLEHVVEPREGGLWFRYVHSGVFTDDWDAQYDGASKHTDFYLHTLGAYLEHFRGQAAAFLDIDAGPASSGPDALEVLASALGIGTDDTVGATVELAAPGLGTGTVDYRTPEFVGVRTETALVRVFGRNAFGATVSLVVHQFSGTPDEAAMRAWTAGVYA